ncbi:centromere DNA-binding protein complex CBF3 subunit [Hirsutella rhossiliensis]|uniref:Centromere DNA-binding protein complex CBF3 subunit n=1 Tax=Hirsutella rhossiliensis TaxID=111463 RepID=A0A9P8SE67_9HYPO|nr:centromere DNA-binding protein complex CBF3 subunit [Hirsutella rhossiliensis]KAH0957726.1 centromere DNA-binding protein complex CBF3 subunit [Hirsutella rhossiliensis]
MARTPNRRKAKTKAGPKPKLAGAAAGAGAGAGSRAKPSSVRVDQRIRQNAINDAELRANAQTILSAIHESRPRNTTSAYAPKQEEFEQFCRHKQYCDGATVTEEKLLLFLVEEVAGRPLKVRSRKAATDTPQDETRLAWRSVRTYVTAITDLYRTQKALGMNTHPSPREDNVREYLKSLQRRDAQRDRENYADKGRDTLLDGYSSPSSNDGEGLNRCMPLIFTTRAGKQNQHGRLETAGAYRNRNPLICILGGLSFYLLYRWDLGSEPFPDFSRRSSWYDIRLIKGNGTGRTAAFSYNSQREWVVKAFAYAGVTSQKKTHEQMVGCYLNSLPRKFMRTMAGHPPQAGCFEIRRAGVTPPEVLLSMIWPELDRWRGRFGPGTEQENDLAAMAPFGTTRSSGIRPTPRSRTSYRTSSLKRSVQASLQS